MIPCGNTFLATSRPSRWKIPSSCCWNAGSANSSVRMNADNTVLKDPIGSFSFANKGEKPMNNTTRTIRSEEITIDMRILTIMEDGRKNGEIYLAAIAPNMELTVITLDEAPGILPCFDEDDACVNIPDSTLMLCYELGAGTGTGRQALPDRPCHPDAHRHGR